MLISAISFGSVRLQPRHADHIVFSYSGGRCRIKWLHADGAFFGLKQGKTVYGSPKICEAVQGKRRLSAEDSPAKVADLRAIFVKKLGFQNKTFATSREGINEVLLAHQEVCRRLSEFLTTPPPGSEAVPPPPNQAIKRSGQM